MSRAAIAISAIAIIGFAAGFAYGYKVSLPPEDPELRRWWWHKMVEWAGVGVVAAIALFAAAAYCFSQAEVQFSAHSGATWPGWTEGSLLTLLGLLSVAGSGGLIGGVMRRRSPSGADRS